MIETFSFLAKEIRLVSGKGQVYYLANPGNWGDALIRHSTLKFFNDYKIPFTEINLTNRNQLIKLVLNIKPKILIYGGGGGWCQNWDIGFPIIKKKLKFFNKVLVLPSTYEKEYYLRKTTFYRRDNYESKQNMPNSFFCHDMAFYFTPAIAKSKPANREAYFFRTDKEGRNLGLCIGDNFDLTKDKNHLDSILPFIKILSNYEIINTDKLHIAILAAKLDKRVNFYSGNYFKNKAVYLSSMKPYFPKVTFIE